MSLDIKDQYDKIYKYCFFKTQNSYLAEDLTQEAFLKYFSQNSYINRGKALAYLYTIARNLCIDNYRRKETLPLNDDIVSQDEFHTFEVSLSIQQVINNLPNDLQELVLLRFVNDLSMVEISNITGLSRYTIYRKTNTALKQLKLVLREEDFVE